MKLLTCSIVEKSPKKKGKDIILSLVFAYFLFFRGVITLFSIMIGETESLKIIKICLQFGMLFSLLVCSIFVFQLIKRDVIIIYSIIGILVSLSIVFTPELMLVIQEEKLLQNIFLYSLFSYVLLRTIDDPKILLNILKPYSYIMIILATIVRFKSNIGTGYMGYSYSMLLGVFVCLYFGFFRKEKIPLVFGIIGIMLNLAGGTRGSIICFFIFFIILFKIKKLYKHFFSIMLLIISGFFFYLFYNSFLLWVANLLTKFNIDSRIITALINNSLDSNNGRSAITDVGLDLIYKQPFGYGFLGERVPINEGIWWFTTNGYSHNIFLEFILQFGVIIGTILAIFYLYTIIKCIITSEKNVEGWRALGIIFISYCSLLLVSRSYATTPEFWSYLAVLFNSKLFNRS